MDSGRVKEIQADCKGRMRWKGRLQGAAAIASGVQWTRAWALAAVVVVVGVAVGLEVLLEGVGVVVCDGFC